MESVHATELPPVKLDHLQALTDDTGILQHAKYSIPNRSEGYTTDDNARALIACIKYRQLFGNSETEKLIDLYMAFLLHMQRSDGKFHNLLGYERQFQDEVGSEDCMGRALWACGYVMNSSVPDGKKRLSKEIFDKGFEWVNTFNSLRAKAYALLGLQHYRRVFPDDENLARNTKTLTDQLYEAFQRASSPNWHWFEPYLTYANARLPQTLFEVYATTKHVASLTIGEKSFTFLIQDQIRDGILFPIGNDGFYVKRANRAFYDQQPLEASCLVDAATAALRVTGDERYLMTANTAFNWFLGTNSQNVTVYDSRTGGCYDGITPHGLNLNLGAESAS